LDSKALLNNAIAISPHTYHWTEHIYVD